MSEVIVIATSPIRLGGKRYAPGDALPLDAAGAREEGLLRHVDIRDADSSTPVPAAPEAAGDSSEAVAPEEASDPEPTLAFDELPRHEDLKAAGVETIEAARALSKQDLLDIEGIGPATAEKMLDTLATA